MVSPLLAWTKSLTYWHLEAGGGGAGTAAGRGPGQRLQAAVPLARGVSLSPFTWAPPSPRAHGERTEGQQVAGTW